MVSHFSFKEYAMNRLPTTSLLQLAAQIDRTLAQMSYRQWLQSAAGEREQSLAAKLIEEVRTVSWKFIGWPTPGSNAAET